MGVVDSDDDRVKQDSSKKRMDSFNLMERSAGAEAYIALMEAAKKIGSSRSL